MIKFKIRISQIIIKILLSVNNEAETRSDTIWQDISNMTSFFLSRNIKVFPWPSKSKFLSFMTKVNPSNGNETKLDIFSWDIFKTDTLSFLSKNIKVFQCLSKSKVLSFMTKVNPSNRNEAKSDIFYDLTLFCIGHKILKYLNNFNNWYFSISMQKWVQTCKEK